MEAALANDAVGVACVATPDADPSGADFDLQVLEARMSRIAEILAAVMAALGRLVSKSVSVMKMVGGRMVRSTEVVSERVFDAATSVPKSVVEVGGATARLVAGAVSDAVKFPFRLARALVGGRRGQQQAPQDAAAEAAQAAQAQVARADAADDARQVLTSLRQVAAARAVGQAPDPAHIGRLPHRLLRYVESLDAEGCDTLARKPTNDLRAIIGAISGRVEVAAEQEAADADRQRSADEDQRPTVHPVADLDAERSARRAQLRQAVRKAMRQQTQEAVEAEAWAAAPRR